MSMTAELAAFAVLCTWFAGGAVFLAAGSLFEWAARRASASPPAASPWAYPRDARTVGRL